MGEAQTEWIEGHVADLAAGGLASQNLDPAALEEIRMLSNIEGEKKKLVQIIFVGQPELRELLASPDLEQLNQRIAVRCYLKPLSLEETGRYVRHRLAAAGCPDGSIKFARDAFKVVHAYSRGIPRKINIACNAVLLAGFVDEKKSFNAQYVRSAIIDLDDSADFDVGVSELKGPADGITVGEAVVGLFGKTKRSVLVGVVAVALGLGSWLAFGNGIINVVKSAFRAIFS